MTPLSKDERAGLVAEIARERSRLRRAEKAGRFFTAALHERVLSHLRARLEDLKRREASA